MSTSEAYEAKIGVITAIAGDLIKTPVSIPVSIYVQEAQNLYQCCLKDEAVLKAKGLEWELVLDLPVRAGALRQAESLWTIRDKQEAAEKEWMMKAPTAYKLRNELLKEFRFAYHKAPEYMARLKLMSSGYGYASMIQNLYELSSVGRKYPEPLARINFDMAQLDRAEAMSAEMASLYAKTNRIRARSNEAKTIRDQAFTHLKEAVDEIRRYGRHVFRDDQERKKGYRSEWLYRRNSKRGSAPPAEATAPEARETPEIPIEQEKNTPDPGAFSWNQ